MKMLKKVSILALTVILSVPALATEDPNSKLVEKAKAAVEEADASDWEILAQSAEICFIKKENTREALEWIDRSLEIKETAYNLEVKGDYLRSIGDSKQAMKYYYNAILKAKEEDPTAENKKLQKKIWELR